MTQKTERLKAALGDQRVIPVIRIERLTDAGPLARALAAGGLRAIEITLRTPDALDAIRVAAAEAPDAVVGAGTILGARQFEQAARAGARFIVSPGTTTELIDTARSSDVPLLPGAITPSEIMALREEGYSMLKFFPAEQAGGMSFLKALSSPIADVSFCPTGGVSAANARAYLDLPNVFCVGGSWVAPDAMIAAGDWTGIEDLARKAATIGQVGPTFA
ncbi:MAG: 2-dehydro-3-deoxy-phosphogluconate aldolase [Rhizobiaceae bacterium]|nr:2-dehydro-3-deoxy-phosphogluconate aldolase [Rhizobiaceae bacterium]MCV0406923.1 2-dehydro-3-deoxy-phosphogluconate aldolase [Rhizobiaceae bacterium]